jgi:hypothetical protein
MSKAVKVLLVFPVLGPLCAMLTFFSGLLIAASFGFDSGRGAGSVPQSPAVLIQNVGRNAWNEIGGLLSIFFGGGGLQATLAGMVSSWWFSQKNSLPFFVPLAAGLVGYLAFMFLIEGTYWYMRVTNNEQTDVSLRDFENPLIFLVLHVALVFWPWLLLRQFGFLRNDPHHT